jgi:hypothetical protein
MKQFILFLAFFGILLAHAQEMDTTFVINEQGQTVGIIHEKGTIPVMTTQQPQQYPMQAQPAPYQPNPAFGYDSTLYYQSIIANYTQSGNKFRRIGNGMMIGGGIGAGVGLILFIAGMSQIETCDDGYSDDYSCEDDGAVAAISGYLLMIGGAAVFSVGLPLKIVGGSKLRRANRYNDILMRYQMKRQYSMKLRLNPLIDPINNNFGGQLALEF